MATHVVDFVVDVAAVAVALAAAAAPVAVAFAVATAVAVAVAVVYDHFRSYPGSPSQTATAKSKEVCP